MGDCTITIHVTGAHNNGRSEDIDEMAKEFVARLKLVGHNVKHATVTNGRTEHVHEAVHKAHNIGPGVPYRNDD